MSDRLCRECGLSVIKNPKKAPSGPLYLGEKSGKPTCYNVYREDLRDAINGSRDLQHMMKYAKEHGFPNPKFYMDDGYTGTNFARVR